MEHFLGLFLIWIALAIVSIILIDKFLSAKDMDKAIIVFFFALCVFAAWLAVAVSLVQEFLSLM